MSRERKILVLFLVLTLIFIWGHSLVPRDASQKESDTVGSFLAPLINFIFGEGSNINRLVRKLAHLAEYALLGAEFTLYFQKKAKRGRIVIGHCFLIAFIDETIQIFNGRGPYISDVWLDVGGAALGMAFALTLKKLIKN